MSETVTLAGLADALLSEGSAGEAGERRVVAIAGSPGSGKSTLADHLHERLEARRPGVSAILPMDGYHLDDRVLVPRGDRPRKGAPHTFDLGGYRAMIERLRADTGEAVAVPVFDRDIEIARAGARIIEPGARIIVTEGNYLLLDEPGWRDLKPLFDLTVMAEAREDTLVARLTERWLRYDYTPEMLIEKMEGNDLPNMRLVLTRSRPADLVIRTDGT